LEFIKLHIVDSANKDGRRSRRKRVTRLETWQQTNQLVLG